MSAFSKPRVLDPLSIFIASPDLKEAVLPSLYKQGNEGSDKLHNGSESGKLPSPRIGTAMSLTQGALAFQRATLPYWKEH